MMDVARELEINNAWKPLLSTEFDQAYMKGLQDFLHKQYAEGHQIYPPHNTLFRALELTSPEQVRVVILGQDPYHGEGQAHGLSFSVPVGVRIPPSLLNIYKELHTDLGVVPAKHGCLESWAQQGVLLLNSVLSVEAGKPASHKNKGWERFTDAVIRAVNNLPQPVVFILWGTYAQKKAGFVDRSKHLVLESVHPSPLSAYGGFFGTSPFSKANAFLRAKGFSPIDWAR